MNQKLFRLCQLTDVPEWANFVAVTATGDVFWWKSEPSVDSSGIWRSADDIHKKIPNVCYPELSGIVVAKSELVETEEPEVCPCCGQVIQNSASNQERDNADATES